MAANSRSQNLFATPLLIANIEDPELNKALEEAILARRAAHPGLRRSNVGGWHSDLQLFDWGGQAARRLRQEILALVNQHTMHAAGQGNRKPLWRMDGWANVNEKGAINARHVHGGSYWSAVYYVRIDEGEGGALVLHDPRMPTLAMHAPLLRFRNAGGEREVRIKPVPGRLIVFPAWLAHEVEPWHGEGLRISIAVNLSAVSAGPGGAALKQQEGLAKAPAAPKRTKDKK